MRRSTSLGSEVVDHMRNYTRRTFLAGLVGSLGLLIACQDKQVAVPTAAPKTAPPATATPLSAPKLATGASPAASPAASPVVGEAASPVAGAGGADLEAARLEGKVVIWHPDQEADVVKFLNGFEEKFSIKTEYLRALPGVAIPKLEAELKAGVSELDVLWMSDVGIMIDLQRQGRLMQYVSPEMQAYAPQYKSNPEGYWTTYYVNVGPMMYSPSFTKKEEAPKTWSDLLDPKWKGQLGMRPSSAGTMYAWWYLLQEYGIAGPDFFEKLAANQPRAYESSTQQLQQISNGGIKIGVPMSIFQYTKAVRSGTPLEMVLPPEGTPSSIQVVGIMATVRRPNAAKLFIDYFLSEEGQRAWNNIQGSYSARPGVTIKELPPFDSIKTLVPKDLAAYASKEKHEEFVKVWDRVTGL